MTTFQTKVSLGDLIAAAFDTAENYSPDPRRSSELAVAAVMHLLSDTGPTPGAGKSFVTEQP